MPKDILFLPVIGWNLKKLRKKHYPHDTQATFAFRIRVSKSTYVKMEKGDLSVSMAAYVEAASRYSLVQGFSELFTEDLDLFEQLGM